MRWRILIPIIACFMSLSEVILFLGPFLFIISRLIELCLTAISALGLLGLVFMFFVNLAAPYWLWPKYSFGSLIPLAVSIFSIGFGMWAFNFSSDYRVRMSLSFLERNITVYEMLAQKMSLTKSDESLCVETYSDKSERHFELKGTMERFAPRGVIVHKIKGEIKDIQFLFVRFITAGRRGFMYSLDGDFRIRPNFVGRYWVPNNISNWCYFHYHYEHGTNRPVGLGRMRGTAPLGAYKE